MSLDSIVQITITTTTTAPSQVGFGVPLIMAFHNHYSQRVRTYTKLADMATDGFSSSEPAYLAAQAILSQTPRPTQIMIGREENTAAKSIKLVPTALNDTLYSLVINTTTFQYLSDSSATVAEITAGLEAAIDAVAWTPTTAYVLYDHVTNSGNVYRCTTAGTSAGAGGPTGTGGAIQDGTVVWAYAGPDITTISAVDNTTDVTVTAATAADWFSLDIADRTLITREDLTADAGGSSGIVDDIQKVTVENDDWYTIHLTNQSEAVINAAAAYIETVKKLMVVTCGNDEILDSLVTDDVASDLYANSYDRTAIIFHNLPFQFPCCAWAGLMLPKDPGSATWKFKSLVGITYETFTSSEIAALNGKRCNFYTRIAGISIMQQGYASSGEWIDTTRGTDWIRARLQERIFGVLANLDKIPFTDPGIAAVEAEVRAQLLEGITNGFLADTPDFIVTVPLAADVSAADKANRILPDVEFTATLAGAVHKVEISGVISL